MLLNVYTSAIDKRVSAIDTRVTRVFLWNLCWDTLVCWTRKSKDYVYGIWIYKVLGMWKGYCGVKKITSFVHETVNRDKKIIMNIINIWNLTPKLHTNSHFWCEPKSGLSCRRQVVHPRPQTPQGESVAKSETPLLIEQVFMILVILAILLRVVA